MLDGRGRPVRSKRKGCSEKMDDGERNRQRAVASMKGKWRREEPEARGGPFSRWDDFLRERQSRSFTLSSMAFQDCFSIDLERLKRCCIHVLGSRGRLIPFCARYCTSLDGRPLYPGP